MREIEKRPTEDRLKEPLPFWTPRKHGPAPVLDPNNKSFWGANAAPIIAQYVAGVAFLFFVAWLWPKWLDDLIHSGVCTFIVGPC